MACVEETEFASVPPDAPPDAPPAPPDSPPDHPGVRLMHLLVKSGDADAGRRRAAREALTRSLPKRSGWSEAWVRFHLGLSLLQETGRGRHQRAMVNLIHLPARFGRRQPYLAGLALAYVARRLEEYGDTGAAARLRAQLQRNFPHHPVRAAGVVRAEAQPEEAE